LAVAVFGLEKRGMDSRYTSYNNKSKQNNIKKFMPPSINGLHMLDYWAYGLALLR
jgi:hypothetical protein